MNLYQEDTTLYIEGNLRNEWKKGTEFLEQAIRNKGSDFKHTAYYKKQIALLKRLGTQIDYPNLEFNISYEKTGSTPKNPSLPVDLTIINGDDYYTIWIPGKMLYILLLYENYNYRFDIPDKNLIAFTKALVLKGDIFSYLWDSVIYNYKKDLEPLFWFTRDYRQYRKMLNLTKYLRSNIQKSGWYPSINNSHAYHPGLDLRSKQKKIFIIIRYTMKKLYEILILDPEHHYNPFERRKDIPLEQIPEELDKLGIKYKLFTCDGLGDLSQENDSDANPS